jgi:cellulose synthase/poly-beta-1,6-N-acetylglucosamine synthase-like glycosyltransferase
MFHSLVLNLMWMLQISVIAYLCYKIQLGKKRVNSPLLSSDAQFEPVKVCVQLPIYNEPKYIEGLIEGISDLDWPHDLLEIQVLDDSNDETPTLAGEAIVKAKIKHPNLTINHIRRDNRIGYKAGALNEGINLSDSEFFAVFDADFRPEPGFLKKMMPSFRREEDNIAAVQARWSFDNEQENMLTKIQSILLKIHFALEHFGRSSADLCFNFNGTAGIWRRSAIESVGGWSFSTVTEDLHLSYLVQLKGWKLKYLHGVTCSSNLPNSYESFFIQQRRWALGNGQVMKITSMKILKSKTFSLLKKFDVMFHLCGYPLAFAASLGVFFYQIFLSRYGGPFENFTIDSPEVIVSVVLWVGLLTTYFRLFGMKELHPSPRSNWLRRYSFSILLLFMSPVLMFLSAGNFWKGIFGSLRKPKNLVFNRTPKRTGNQSKFPKLLLVLFLVLISNCYFASQNGYTSISVILLFQAALIPLATANRKTAI